MPGTGRALATPPDAPPSPELVTSKHYSREFAALTDTYTGDPIDVSFRQLVGPLPANEYTHGLYPYPARLLRHIPRFLLATDAIVDGIDLVFDPFVGSGTVLLEAQLRGLAAVGVEQNPVAALASRVKVLGAVPDNILTTLTRVLDEARRTRRKLVPSTALERWYSAGAFSALARLASQVAAGAPEDRDLLALCLALTARRVARTDPRIPVPVTSERNATATSADVWKAWASEAEAIARKLGSLPPSRPEAHVIQGDARNSAVWPNAEQAQSTLLLSSPPYGAAQKYVRSTSLEAGWLGFAPHGRTIHIEHDSIGREHLSAADKTVKLTQVWSDELRADLALIAAKDHRRAAIYVTYFTDMQNVFQNARARSVKRIALVTGTNNVVGGTLHTSQHLAAIVRALGYRHTISLRDPIRGRSLLTARRNGTPSPSEYIDVFEVPDGA
ncbi:hypothetical protein SAMN04488591_2048 [Microbacterium azadirachtae]|uniref:DNA methylase n=2 Tax=Microbacterium azadirachtae TaxID=582680 RepID=A0A1I6HRG2_9MICO|nr:hypothetical protein SAMN04488591_2048 [Microbacterium azadirachtae]